MTTAFQQSAFQNNAWQIDAGAVAAETVVIPGGVRRKTRILPDGRRIFATEQEAVDALLIYYSEHKLKDKEAAVLGLKPNRKKIIVMPSERMEIVAAVAMLQNSDYLRRRQEEEWLVLFH